MCIWQSDSIILAGHNCFLWKQSAPPRVLNLRTKLVVGCWMYNHCCHLAPDESQPWKWYVAILEGYLSHGHAHAVPNPSPVASCLTFPSSSSPKPCWGISLTTCQPTVTESIWHYQLFPKPASSQQSPKYLQPLSPCARIHLEAVSNSSFTGQWAAASSPETHPPILSSTCRRC